VAEAAGRPVEKYFYFVDGVRYETDQEVLTGAQIKARIPNFENALVLMLEGTGKEPDTIRSYNPVQRFSPIDPGFKEGINRYSYSLNSPTNGRDPFGLWTFSFGLTLNLQFGVVNVEGSYGVVVDGTGNFGLYGTTGGGLGVGAKASVGASVGWSPNAKTICALGGPFQYGSVSAGAGLDGTVDEFTGYSDGSPIIGGGLTVGVGVGGGVSGGINGTVIIPAKDCCK
jgi:hypothetical protein